MSQRPQTRGTGGSAAAGGGGAPSSAAADPVKPSTASRAVPRAASRPAAAPPRPPAAAAPVQPFLEEDDPLIQSYIQKVYSKTGQEITYNEIMLAHKAMGAPLITGKPVPSKPMAFVICGPTASGKSTIRAQLLKEKGITSQNVITIDPDLVLETQPQYKTIQKMANYSARRPYFSTYILIDVFLDKYIESRHHIIFDTTCRNAKFTNTTIEKMKAQGYTIVFVEMYVSKGTSLARAQARGSAPGGRKVAPVDVEKIYAEFSASAEAYLANPNLDEIYLFNNEKASANGTVKPTLLLHQEKGKPAECRAKGDFYFDLTGRCPAGAAAAGAEGAPAPAVGRLDEARAKAPFYIKPTLTPEAFVSEEGKASTQNLYLLSLPPGTVLFRGVKIPNIKGGQDFRFFYRDFLGDPEANGRVCLNPTHNVFFYTNPLVAFGTNDVGKTFHSIQAVVLINPVTVICALGPTPLVRGAAKAGSGTAPWQRCDKFDIACHELTEKEKDALKYDNCIHPDYAVRSSVRGWMALANQDSINPRGTKTFGSIDPKDSSMGSWLRRLEERRPGLAADILTHTYTDKLKNIGFPEVALYPYRKHPGMKKLIRKFETNTDALEMIEKEASYNNLNYLPLAAFTKDGTVDMVNGHFDYRRMGVKVNTFVGDVAEKQPAIEEQVLDWFFNAQERGLKLPFYGDGTLQFDSRTGFYALKQVVPGWLRVPLPPRAGPAAGAAPAAPSPTELPYYNLLLPLRTPEEKLRALNYRIYFRTYFDNKFLANENYIFKIKPEEKTIRRAFVLARPPEARRYIYDALEIPTVPLIDEALKKAGVIYTRDKDIAEGTFVPKSARAEAAPRAARGSAAAAGGGGDGVEAAEGEAVDGADTSVDTSLALTDGAPAEAPAAAAPEQGGGRRKKWLHKSRRAGQGHGKGRTTTRKSNKTGLKYAMAFSRVWNAHARLQKRINSA